MINYPKINGLIAAVFTPFHPDGSINPALVSTYADRLKRQGVAGVFVNGSSGEGMLLSVEERKAMAEAWAVHGTADFKIIVHVGSTSVQISKELAAHSQQIGVDAVGCMAPCFLTSSDVDVIVDYCQQVASAAPELPFYYYHLPVATGAHIKVNQLLERGSKRIPNLAGVKFTYTDFMDMHQCLALQGGRFDVLHGHDEILINGLVLGVQGAIGTTFNFIPEVYHKLMEAYQDGDFAAARAYQMQSIDIVTVMLRYVNAVVGGKAILKLAGLDCGPCRTPLRNLTSAEWQQLEQDLQKTDFFELLTESRLVGL
ncbi:N-acetylneuraminate lyase [Larkinella arboricola]|uniref:N-acetylneuraminate lyase n=1 Tax=Larkinella arboricola TaxID=643671 RepID=A0A327WLA4_LARAB|nr:dihydrodipicolinate synthase family protein [Larkinella arboricola]RAJ91031.1 N-acetylneuraminate lyase [Larkinella arboricola]